MKTSLALVALLLLASPVLSDDSGLQALMTDGDPTDSPLLNMPDSPGGGSTPPKPDDPDDEPKWIIIGYNYTEDGRIVPVMFDLDNGPFVIPEGFTDIPVWPETPLDQVHEEGLVE